MKGEIEMKKIFLIIIMVVLFSITLVGYGQAQEGKYEVAVIIKATTSDFWQYVLIGAENAAKDNPAIHVTTYGPPSEADMDKQLSILEDVISRKPDGIVISSTSSDATVPALEQAYDAGIKIVTIDNKVKTDKVHSFLATDNVEGGGKIAKELVDGLKAKGIPLKGKVGFISAMAGVQVLIDRAKGFTDKLKELAPDLEIIGPRYVDNDVLKALSTAEDILTAYSDVWDFLQIIILPVMV